jgi:NDP-sugar pyrophosphorylase family protein
MECVVLAAGEGKRMRPLTERRPKVMLPLANRPMMEHLVCAARDAGITDFVFVVGYGEREIRSYFGDGSGLGIDQICTSATTARDCRCRTICS